MKPATTLTIALATVLAAMPPASLHAQQAFATRVTAGTEARSLSPADQLHERAVEQGERGTIDGWRSAARLHLESAAKRSASDGLAERCLHEAADLLYATGDLPGAQRAALASAEHAAARGDVIAAANSYLDAAVVAQDQRQPGAVREYVAKARLLVESPLLSEGQRRLLVSRLPK